MWPLYYIWIALLAQVAVDGTIEIVVDLGYDMMQGLRRGVVTSYSNRDATELDTTTSLVGCIEVARPPDACTHIAIPTFKPNVIKRNIVLINGTQECDFMTKIRYAKEVGFEGAVLFDPFPEPFNYSDMVPTVVLVNVETGIEIRENYLYPKTSVEENEYMIILPTTAPTDATGLYVILGIFALFAIPALLYKVSQEIKKRSRKSLGRQNEEQNDAVHSCEQSSDSTALLTSPTTREQNSASTRTGDSSRPSYASVAVYSNPLHFSPPVFHSSAGDSSSPSKEESGN